MIQNCDSQILYLQKQVSDYALIADQLLTDQKTELTSRSEIRKKLTDDVESTVTARLVSACSGSTNSVTIDPVSTSDQTKY